MKNEEFEKYVQSFDMSNPKVELKYNHTYRVVDYCIKIGKSLNLNEHDMKIAELCGLLHDIARFEQAIKYDTFNDWQSFDHGDRGYDILKENNFISKFIESEDDQKIILKAVKLHNKKYLEEGLNEREELFCKIIRDADKLDIMDNYGFKIEDESTTLNKEAFDEIRQGKLVTYENAKNGCTLALKSVGYIFDINFKESFKELVKMKFWERKYDLYKNHLVPEELDELNEIITTYIKKKIEE